MQIKKNVIFLIIFVVLTIVFAGCYQERTKVKFWAMVKGKELHIMRGLIAKFNYLNPDCELQLKVFNSSLNYYQSILHKSLRKNGPDIVYIVDGWISKFSHKGYLRRLKEVGEFPSLAKWDSKIITNLKDKNGYLYGVPDSINYFIRLKSRQNHNNSLIIVNPADYYIYSSQFELNFRAFTNWLKSVRRYKFVLFRQTLKQHYKMVNQDLVVPVNQLSRVENPLIVGAVTGPVFKCYAITSRSKDVEESVRFIKFMNKKEHLLRFISVGKRFNLRSDFKTVTNNLVNDSVLNSYDLVPSNRQLPRVENIVQSYFGKMGFDMGEKH